MNYQIIPGFEDIRIGYVIKKNKNETKRRHVRIVLCIEKNKQTNKQTNKDKQKANSFIY